jgi:hypothetical protein
MGARLKQNIERLKKSAHELRQASMLDKPAAAERVFEDLIDCLEEIERKLASDG